MILSSWMPVPEAEHCYMRILLGSDPKEVRTRFAFIEKTPRIRKGEFTKEDTDYLNWESGPKGCAPEYGEYIPSREWCDERLIELGYTLID